MMMTNSQLNVIDKRAVYISPKPGMKKQPKKMVSTLPREKMASLERLKNQYELK